MRHNQNNAASTPVVLSVHTDMDAPSLDFKSVSADPAKAEACWEQIMATHGTKSKSNDKFDMYDYRYV